VVSQGSGDSGGALNPMNTTLGNPKANAQAVVKGTEVVDVADQKHAIPQGFGLASEGAPSSNQASQSLAEGGIEPLNESGIDPASLLAGFDQLFNQLSTALSDTTLNGEAAIHPSFDDLNNSDFLPDVQARTSSLVTFVGATQCLPERLEIGSKTIYCHQDGTTQGLLPNLSRQRPHQRFIAADTHYTAQPQSCADHHRHRHPHRTPLRLGLDLVRLYLLQIATFFLHKVAVYSFTVQPCLLQPLPHRFVVQPKCHHNRLHRTPVCQQRHHQHKQFRALLDPIQCCPRRGAECLPAYSALTSLLFLTVYNYTVIAS